MQSSYSQFTSVYFVLSITSYSALSASTCYFPKGGIATYDIPCRTASKTTACCGQNAFCLADGYCLSANVLTRGSCTDQSWKSSECALDCKNFNPTTGHVLTSCDLENHLWSCEDCTQSNFTIHDSLLLRNYQVASIGLSSEVTIQAQTPLSAAASTSSSTDLTSTNRGAGTPPISASSSSCVPLLELENQKSGIKSDDQKKQVAIGAGIGVPLGIAAICFLILFLIERGKTKHATWEREQTLATQSNQKHNAVYPETQQSSIPLRELYSHNMVEVDSPVRRFRSELQ